MSLIIPQPEKDERGVLITESLLKEQIVPIDLLLLGELPPSPTDKP